MTGGRQLAVVDTSTLVLLATHADHVDDPRTRQRALRTQDNVTALHREGVTFIVPAPVIVELSRDGPGKDAAARIMAALGGLRVEALDLEAASYAGEMCRPSMRKKPHGKEKNAIRFDALIAAIAHRVAAKYILTANPAHFKEHLEQINSPVEVYAIDLHPPTGQLRMLTVPPGHAK